MNGKDVRKLVIACDAGMGSSVMLAGHLRKSLKKQNVTVEHTPVDSIPGDADVVVCHSGLAARARRGAGDAPVIPFEVYLGDPAVDRLVKAIKDGGEVGG
ncbi:PTS lactose transporter subunit IIB [Actinomadura sp. CNU-125]|uniref:PTS lactose transporter subunit IIB n=1 Tax=Actinomadura sp. CNU-125 TaxID=1904961 RepID=UPI00095AD1D1|nr:PTS lactose transporter subunit IIB [Actinomadura sp. CNU-125]OLT28891.1 PTS lactose transporter subunit IIB [Actinomadura sp. CNU-125]